jgi:hypothetical protein
VSAEECRRLDDLTEEMLTFDKDAPYANPDPRRQDTKAAALLRVGLNTIEEHSRRGDESLRQLVGPGTSADEVWIRIWACLSEDDKEFMEDVTPEERSRWDGEAAALKRRRLDTVKKRARD